MNGLAKDLDFVLEQTREYWEEVRGNRIFITGGTGFFGCWLLETFIWANEALNLHSSATVLTRNPGAFGRKAPHLAYNPSIRLIQGDIKSFEFPDNSFTHVIHAATESSERLNREDPLVMLDTIIQGTRRVLEFAINCRAGKFLLASSGAVYGRQPWNISHISEEHQCGPDPMDAHSAYAEGKRVSELLCRIYGRDRGVQAKIARCFAFVGPYLPLDAHFAIGNFICDSLSCRNIRIKGDGTPVRSYLYAADLMIWLWTILFRGEANRPYNVGSEDAIEIRELATAVRETTNPDIAVEIQESAAVKGTDRYVPSTKRARYGLGLKQTIDLRTAIEKTYEWNRIHGDRAQ